PPAALPAFSACIDRCAQLTVTKERRFQKLGKRRSRLSHNEYGCALLSALWERKHFPDIGEQRSQDRRLLSARRLGSWRSNNIQSAFSPRGEDSSSGSASTRLAADGILPGVDYRRRRLRSCRSLMAR